MKLPRLTISRPAWAFGNYLEANEFEEVPLAGLYAVTVDGRQRIAVLTLRENRAALMAALAQVVEHSDIEVDAEGDFIHIPSGHDRATLQKQILAFVFADAERKPRVSWTVLAILVLAGAIVAGLVIRFLST